MDMIAAPVSEKMFWIDGETSLKQDDAAFQDILITEASNTQTQVLTENQKAPISEPVTEDIEEAVTEQATPSPLPVIPFENTKVADPKPVIKSLTKNELHTTTVKNKYVTIPDPEPGAERTYKAEGGPGAQNSEVTEKEHTSIKLNPEISAPVTAYPKKVTDLSPYPAREPLVKFPLEQSEQVVPVVTDEVNIAIKVVSKEGSLEAPEQTVNTQKDRPLVQKAVPDYSQKEALPDGSSNSREFASRPQQTSDLRGNPSARDVPAKNPSVPVQGERNGQVNTSGAIKGSDLYEAADLTLKDKEIPGVLQQKNVPSEKKNEKAEEANEKYSLFSDQEEEAPRNEYKTLKTSQAEGSLKEDFSSQKQQHHMLKKTLEPARENNIELNHTEIQDEGLSTEELNGEKRFQSLVNGEKRDAETSQATRKETAGYLFRKIDSFIKTGKNEFSLKLYPEALGALQVKISSNGDLLNIHMTAQSHLSKSVIESTLIELKASLAEQGFQTDQLSVSVGKDGSFSSTGNSNMNNDSSERPHSRFPSRPEDESPGNETTAPGMKRKFAPGFSNVNIFA